MSETKKEMTAEEFVNYVVSLRTYACFMTEYDIDSLKKEVTADLRSVIREKLKEFCHRYLPDRNEIAYVDEFLKNNQ